MKDRKWVNSDQYRTVIESQSVWMGTEATLTAYENRKLAARGNWGVSRCSLIRTHSDCLAPETQLWHQSVSHLHGPGTQGHPGLAVPGLAHPWWHEPFSEWHFFTGSARQWEMLPVGSSRGRPPSLTRSLLYLITTPVTGYEGWRWGQGGFMAGRADLLFSR